eukprot:7384909-Prymnesium_polylepis.1
MQLLQILRSIGQGARARLLQLRLLVNVLEELQHSGLRGLRSVIGHRIEGGDIDVKERAEARVVPKVPRTSEAELPKVLSLHPCKYASCLTVDGSLGWVQHH